MTDETMDVLDAPETVVSGDLKPLSLYSNNGLSTFDACERLYYFTHIRHWRKDGKAAPLAFGSSWHAAMDTIWYGHETIRSGDKKAINALIDQAHQSFIATWVESGFPHPDNISPDELEDLGARTPQTALEMLYNYVEQRKNLFCDKSFKLLHVERPFAVPLDPNNKELFYVGRLDKEFEWRGRVYVLETKTTTAYKKIGFFRTDFIDSFSPNSQIDAYCYQGLLTYGAKFGGVWVDAALVHKTVHDGFVIIPIEKRHEALESWLWTAHNSIARIKGNVAALDDDKVTGGNYLAAFPMNTTSCNRYSRCSYSDLCCMLPNPAKVENAPMGFKVEHHSMFDALKLDKLGFKRVD